VTSRRAERAPRIEAPAPSVPSAKLLSAAPRDERLATLSHALKNPLGAIWMNVTALLEVAGEEAPVRRKRQLDAILRSTRRMISTIGDYVDFAALADGSLPLYAAAWDVRPLVTKALDAVGAKARSLGVRLLDELPSVPAIRVDRDRLVRALTSLVINGVKFTPRGGNVFVRARVTDRAVLLSIADTGCGMSRAQLAHVLERFLSGRTEPEHGSGLRLAMAKSFVELSGGRLDIASELDSGTTVTLTLPRDSPA
jgi:signal transduction histidine kinase